MFNKFLEYLFHTHLFEYIKKCKKKGKDEEEKSEKRRDQWSVDRIELNKKKERNLLIVYKIYYIPIAYLRNIYLIIIVLFHPAIIF